jgi:hypothetical protein
MALETAALPLLSNLTNLPTQQAKGLGSVGGKYYEDIAFSSLFIRTGAIAPAATGFIKVFLVTAEEKGLTPSRFTDGIDPDATTNQAGLLGSSNEEILSVAQLGSPGPALTANTTYCIQGFGAVDRLRYKPKWVAIVVLNRMGNGAAFSPTLADHYGSCTLVIP